MLLLLNLWKIQDFCWALQTMNDDWYFSVGPTRWLQACILCMGQAVSFLDEIVTHAWKAGVTLKAKSLGLTMSWELQVSQERVIKGLKTHLFCLPNPSQSQVLSLLSLEREESKTETHPTLLSWLIQFVKTVVRHFTAVSQAYCAEQNHISWLILQLWWLRDTECWMYGALF